MSDRGLPIVDGAQACPFVAFENDRDERATSPDHRHRCYAEERPAPRALAHQAAYCLASTFPVCPTFQDWARREAAQARAGSGGAEPLSGDEEGRNPPRDWSAPPQWGAAAGAGAAAAGTGMFYEDDAEDEGAPGFLASRSAAAGAGLAGSAADRLAGSGRGNGDVKGDAPAFGPADEQDQRRAARLDAIGEDDMSDERADDRYGAPLDEDELESERPGRPRSARASGGIGFGRDRRPKVGDTRRARGWDEAGPSWEQPRHNEPYPPLRSRGPRVSRVAAMAIVIVVAAIGLFFLPQLLGVGNAPPGTGDRTSAPPGVTAGPSVSLDPTPVPAATPQIYIVKSGDNMSKIAALFGVSLDDLIAANRETHPNPDTLQIGDEVIIPTPSAGGSPEPSPSA
ncbi:MAG: LysM peptidoglycan-binding domain-containing protein [Chloroflexota bacterium]